MKTAYLTTLSTTLSPFSAHAKTPRLILSLLPPNARTRIAIKTTLLPRSSALVQPATLEMGFKDGKKMQWTWMPKAKKSGEGGVGKSQGGKRLDEGAKVKDVVEEVERHYRVLARKEELAG
jgi:large subunit ribosomal protein L53